uniref:Rab GTPase 2c n=1 Tax=Euplotoides octocarinatus TaxID=2716877 RepID=E2GMZ0_EUPOC|nr:Rab GTPase 2c [Euplotes octocarinatus]
MTQHDCVFKISIIGDTAVGKSCLLKRITENEFKESYELTIGVEFGSILFKTENKILKLQIWDTAGQENFKSITKIFYRGTHCVFLAYDITRESTFQNASKWLNEVKQNSGNDVIVFLVGTQYDKDSKRAVSEEDAKAFMEKHELDYFIETSAKTNHNIEKLFTTAAQKLYIKFKTKIENMLDEGAATVENRGSKVTLDSKINSSEHKKKKGCSC